ncbi:MAG TPA: GNAT family N-acetyltransferase [Actinocrinis sp.]|nr:GNAT family N-acetyltransferase [Actinocrinis sp.]
METRYPVRLAVLGDLPQIISLIDSAASWLRTKATDQWAAPWPSPEAREARIQAAIANKITWVMTDGPDLVATVSFDHGGDPKLWQGLELGEPAVYLHRLVINRRHEGLGIGAEILEWAIADADEKSDYQMKWARIDVWTTNTKLHEYYRKLGFEDVRCEPEDNPGYPSCALFQKAVTHDLVNSRKNYLDPSEIVKLLPASQYSVNAH